MPDSRLDLTIIAAPYTVDSDEFIAVMYPVFTTSELADATSRINTVDKFTGKTAYDSTFAEPVYAAGPLATDAWTALGNILARTVNGDFLQPTATTAELAAIGDLINTQNKRAGKMVFDTTLGQPVWADGGAVGDTWSLSTGIVAHTPV